MSDLRPVDSSVDAGIEPKYVVISIDDWMAWQKAGGTGIPRRIEGGCFVIREQDVFGPQALFGYANTIQSGLELDAIAENGGVFTEEQRTLLAEWAHAITNTALAWQRTPKKVPD